MSTDNYAPVVNVKVPDPDPEETQRVFHEISKRPAWSTYATSDAHTPVVPPTSPPEAPRPTDDAQPEPEDDLPVGDGTTVHLAVAEEHMEDRCWNCGGKEQRVGKLKKLPSGTVLCAACEQIMKPGM